MRPLTLALLALCSVLLAACGPQQKPLPLTQTQIGALNTRLLELAKDHDAAASEQPVMDMARLVKRVIEKDLDHSFDLTLRRVYFLERDLANPAVFAALQLFLPMAEAIHSQAEAWQQAGLISPRSVALFAAEKAAGEYRLTAEDEAFLATVARCEAARPQGCDSRALLALLPATAPADDSEWAHARADLLDELPLRELADAGVLVDPQGEALDVSWRFFLPETFRPLAINPERLQTLRHFSQLLQEERRQLLGH